jgi:hypothetical protein
MRATTPRTKPCCTQTTYPILRNERYPQSAMQYLTSPQIFLQVADDFVDDLITAACRLAKLRGSATLDIRDLQLVLERQYNIRVPGFSSDEIRTVRRPQPAAGWAQKMGAVQAAKLTGGGSASAGTGMVNGVKDT